LDEKRESKGESFFKIGKVLKADKFQSTGKDPPRPNGDGGKLKRSFLGDQRSELPNGGPNIENKGGKT